MGVGYDFSGWATRNDLRCSDGRVIRKDAFIGNDGSTVPLVWNHDHGDPDNILGHALLENRDEGVYAYCSFNDNPKAVSAKNAVKNHDIRYMSIYANHLKQNGCNVMHGAIREVSLVLAGANPGAEIETILAHSDEDDEEGKITTGFEIELVHSDEDIEYYQEPQVEYYPEEVPEYYEQPAEYYEQPVEYLDEEAYHSAMLNDSKGENMNSDRTVKEVYDGMSKIKKDCLTAMIALALSEGEEAMPIQHGDTDGPTIKDIFETFTPEEKTVAMAMIGEALKSREMSHSDYDYGYDYYDPYYEGEDYEMKHNVFEGDYEMDNVIQHGEVLAAIEDAQRFGSMRDSFLQHGLADIDILFPDAHQLNDTPIFVDRDQGWVSVLMNGTTHTPFARIKSTYADITDDEARALGYMPDRTHRDTKGNLVDASGNAVFKKEEVIKLLKRVTTPTTVYKKQKMDRDDVIDITDFDVIAWLKQEMRGKLNEELARAMLIGDGRAASSEDKINEDNIRPIVSDSNFYTIKLKIVMPQGSTQDDKMKAMIKGVVKARAKFKGTGNPTFFTTEANLADLLLLEDSLGHRLYKSEQELTAAMRVAAIYGVPVMEGYKDSEGNTVDLGGVAVNPKDYTVGADKGGAVNFFDDFDIDYNKQKYLIETRCCGALTLPYSAIAVTFGTAATSTVKEVAYEITTGKTIVNPVATSGGTTSSSNE